MPLLLDGNNLVHRLPGSTRSRTEVRRLVLEATRHERLAVVVVFDGPPPPGSPLEEALGSVTVLWSGPVSADDTIVGKIPNGPAAGQWTVITDDRGLADRARRRGARVRRLSEWQARRTAPPRRPRTEPKLSSREVDEWEAFFSRERGDGD